MRPKLGNQFALGCWWDGQWVRHSEVSQGQIQFAFSCLRRHESRGPCPFDMLQFLFCANEYRIESEQVRRLEGVFADPQLSGIRNAPLLSLAYHLACGVDCSACFDLDEDNHPVFLRDYVNFANLASPVCFQNFKAVRQKVTLCRRLAALAHKIIYLRLPRLHRMRPPVSLSFLES